MALSVRAPTHPLSSAAYFIGLLLLLLSSAASVHSIGVNYGTLGDNLPPPAQVARFLKDRTTIDRIKIFDTNPDILRAFAGTGILVAVTVPNGEIPSLANDPSAAARWVAANVSPYHPATRINYVFVGTEVLHWGPQELRDALVPAMRALHRALADAGLVRDVQVTTAHSLGILESSDPPSRARFRPGWAEGNLAPALQFHRETNSTFMVNPYPFFSYSPENASFNTFGPNPGRIYDRFTRRTYGSMFDLLMDAVYVSMMKLGYKDVGVGIGETGWAWTGDILERPRCSVENAVSYNGGLVRKYNSGRGTPLMPRRRFETYLFALFNENQKTGPLSERSFGLFNTDFSPVYDIGIMRGGVNTNPAPQPVPKPSRPAPTEQNKTWCMAKENASASALQDNINYVCGLPGQYCQPIQPGGRCFDPNNLWAHASFAMNAFYQANGRNNFNCDFKGSGVITFTDPIGDDHSATNLYREEKWMVNFLAVLMPFV
ncbi:glucan endo-1 3-beta-glucosidas [Striga asiatica]|uniref:glucan endo-1,3-beta-D-glucosidase n=1 Tax=Striga asiatica TaxID=4170 RepID=A0A5A7PVI4_STRAF|nr:glucan endo-1 3-beta-glucosidas [Striga asiatica]